MSKFSFMVSDEGELHTELVNVVMRRYELDEDSREVINDDMTEMMKGVAHDSILECESEDELWGMIRMWGHMTGSMGMG